MEELKKLVEKISKDEHVQLLTESIKNAAQNIAPRFITDKDGKASVIAGDASVSKTYSDILLDYIKNNYTNAIDEYNKSLVKEEA